MARENVNVEPVPNDLEGIRRYVASMRADFDSHNHDGANSKKFQTMRADTAFMRTIAMIKTSFTDTKAGLWVGIISGVVKFALGSASNYVKFDGTTLTIAANLTASSLDIPDTSTTASFHVDSSGNTWWGATSLAAAPAYVTKDGDMRVNSLERNDFHWFTIFESIDGYAKGGTGTQTLNQDSVTLATTTSANSESELQKIASYANNFSFSKRRKIRFGFVADQNTSQYIDMVTGGVSYGANTAHFGFRVLNGTLYSLSDSGSGETTTSLVGTIATGTVYELEARLNPGVSIEYYVNGSLLATHTDASIPSGTNNANYLLDFYIRATSASLRSFKFTYYDFWQET